MSTMPVDDGIQFSYIVHIINLLNFVIEKLYSVLRIIYKTFHISKVC